MIKPHHRKKISHGMWRTGIALVGVILALMVLRAHQTAAYLEEEARYLFP
jgi:type II secretory pathway component PulL